MERITDNIFRIKVPFENIYTTVFIITTKSCTLIFDTATYSSDIDGHILPAIEKAGLKNDIKYVFLSHSHGDHAGGITRFVQAFPNVRVITRSQLIADAYDNSYIPKDRETIADDIEVITIKGHADDCMALFDKRTNTLLTGDCLQVYGVFGRGDWGTGITDASGYFDDLDKLRKMDIKTLIASHDYHPLGYIATGDGVQRYIDTCELAVQQLIEFCKSHSELDENELRELYKSTYDLPVVSKRVFAAYKKRYQN